MKETKLGRLVGEGATLEEILINPVVYHKKFRRAAGSHSFRLVAYKLTNEAVLFPLVRDYLTGKARWLPRKVKIKDSAWDSFQRIGDLYLVPFRLLDVDQSYALFDVIAALKYLRELHPNPPSDLVFMAYTSNGEIIKPQTINR